MEKIINIHQCYSSERIAKNVLSEILKQVKVVETQPCKVAYSIGKQNTKFALNVKLEFCNEMDASLFQLSYC